VIADLVDVARLGEGQEALVPYLGFQQTALKDLPVLPIEHIHSAYYLRMSAEDHPGVLAKVSSIMSELGINIESVIQNEADRDGDLIPLVMLTHVVEEGQMLKAIEQIEALPEIKGDVVRIRVEQF